MWTLMPSELMRLTAAEFTKERINGNRKRRNKVNKGVQMLPANQRVQMRKEGRL
jgi:hypothetical protein